MNLKSNIDLYSRLGGEAPDVDPKIPGATKLPFGHRVHQGKIHKRNLQDKFFVKPSVRPGSMKPGHMSAKVVRRRKLHRKPRRKGIRLT